MRISKYMHACLLVENEGDKILFDPGKFTFIEGLVKPDDFKDLSAVILTHQHPDHMDDESLKKILENNGAAVVITNTEIQSRLAEEGITAELLEEGRRAVGGFTLEAVAAEHAKLLNAKTPQNTAYLVNGALLHPGDSYDTSLDVWKGVKVLALPIMAPWTTELETADFASRMQPQQVIPIHDGYAKDFFLKQRYENFKKYFAELGIDFYGLSKPGEGIDF